MMKKYKQTTLEKVSIWVLLIVIVFLVLAILSFCTPPKMSEFMWGKEGSAIKSVPASCTKSVKHIHVPYNLEPTVCNHDFHYASQLMCLPKVCLDSDMAWTIREIEVKDKLYEQYLKTHSR